MFTKITYLKDAVSYVEAAGKLDIYAAPDYLEKIKEHLKNRYTKELVLEFSEITFIASIGLRTILELHKIMQEKNGILKLKNVTKEVLYSFEITGFDKFLIIENDSEEEKREREKSLKQSEKETPYSIAERMVETELGTYLYGLNKWYDQTAIIMDFKDSGKSIESNIIQTLLKDDEGFNATIKVYEQVSNDKYVNELTNKHISFDKEIQLIFEKLIPKLKDIRERMKND